MGASSSAGERKKNIPQKKYYEEEDYEDYDEGQIEKERILLRNQNQRNNARIYRI